MSKRWLVSFFGFLAFAPGPAQADIFDISAQVPEMTLGFDPNGPDSVYMLCSDQTANSLTLEIWVGTDNFDPNDALGGLFIPIELSADKPGVTLDASDVSVYSGTALATWEYRAVNVASGGGPPNGNPSSFPMQLVIGGVDFDESEALQTGDHLVARLQFSVSEPTNICLTGAFEFQGNGLLFVTALKNGYPAALVTGCCGPVVPTLSQWGMIIFAAVLLGSAVWYLRRRKLAQPR